MAWSFSDLFDTLGDQVQGMFDAFTQERQEGGLAALVMPIDPFNRSSILAPIIGAAGVISALMLSGVAVGALATMLAALLALYFLLSRVFGYEISLDLTPSV